MGEADEITTRAGHVALVGRPNVGKSTLLNALVGEKLSIVTPRAQTTRESVTGILTTERTQAIFVDTPGLLEPKYTLQRAMHETALEVIADADIVLLLLDATHPGERPQDDAALAALRRKRDHMIVLINKIDEGSSDAVETLRNWAAAELQLEPLLVSAARGDGIDELRARLEQALPPSPFFYPEDELAIQPVRFFVAELVRETIFENYEQEVPYSTIVRVEEFRENEDPVYIRATIYVERESQKPILIGRGGAGIRELGSRSREKIEAFLGTQVYLDLWIKALPNWRANIGTLRYLGYRLPSALVDGDAEARATKRRHGAGRKERRD
jgi:GTPase